MASTIGTNNGTSFNAVNMKPAVDEQIDSLWGQNVGDNLAYCLWGKQQKLFDVQANLFDDGEGGNGRVRGFSSWRKIPTHDTIDGTVRIESQDPGDSVIGTILLDGNLVWGSTLSTGSVHEGFTFDQSGLDDGGYYDVDILVVNSQGNRVSMGISAWSGTFFI